MPVIRQLVIKVISIILLSSALNVFAAQEKNEVVFSTNKGEIVILLNPQAAPISVENFKQYVAAGFYDGSIFHRTIPNFMIQGGGFDASLKRKTTQAPIQNEAENGLKNAVGTISMAKTGDPHSATSQFFINVNDNRALDHRNTSSRGWGYAVFGKVTKGMDIVMGISRQKTKFKGGHQNVPVDTVVIEKAELR